MIAELVQAGFAHAGTWQLQNAALQYTAASDMLNYQYVLYAFTSENEILYIGKTPRKISKVFDSIKSPGVNEASNIKLYAQLAQQLQTAPVEIHILKDPALQKVPGEDIIMLGVRENDLIQQFRPKWNSGKMKLDKPRSMREANV